jgi:hypothetical protein
MELLIALVMLVGVIAAPILWWKLHRTRQENAKAKTRSEQLEQALSQTKTEHYAAIQRLQDELAQLEKFRPVVDAEAKAREIIAAANKFTESSKIQAEGIIARAEAQANEIITRAKGLEENTRNAIAADKASANRDIKAKKDAADANVAAAVVEATRIIESAKARAQEIAGDALEAKDKADTYEKAIQAMKNVIEGYDDRYILPTYSLLDELAEEFGHTEAGQALKNARDHTKRLIRLGQAATCDYVEANRKETAIRFVIDAFNGKVDTILSRSKADNFGTLKQQILDAANLVNLNGAAFRDAKITHDYLESRLDELKWAVVAQELKEREREEQRRIREQIREEERAQKEFEKALRDAAKEEAMLQKAMDKVRAELGHASEAQRAKYETQLAELEEKLKQAEEKNQRALSMAQQTKAGHVYVISNTGSFGEEVFKIGMTRRLEPKDRIQELGDASVPFPFDIHAMIYSQDAPGLERSLHKHFLRRQMNKVNPRKEFFRVSLSDIRNEIATLGIDAHWTIAAEAREYRESLAIEHTLQADPGAAQDWLKYQLEIDPVADNHETDQSDLGATAEDEAAIT